MSTLYAKNKFVRKLISRTSHLVAPYYWEHIFAQRVRELMGRPSLTGALLRAEPLGESGLLLPVEDHWSREALTRSVTGFSTNHTACPKTERPDGGQQIVSCVLDHRNVEEKLHEVLQEIGAPPIGSLPREKTKRIYRDWYTKTRGMVARALFFEIETMGYRFEDPEPDRPIVRKI